VTLGLGKGRLEQDNGKLVFHPDNKLLDDGLPEDAWTDLEQTRSVKSYPRPFNRGEIEKIFNTPIPDE
jgi:hypothetical protein